MKFRHTIRSTLSLFVFALATTSLTGASLAGDMPKRKSGLWEINMRHNGSTGMGPVQQCIDQNTDNLMQQKAKDSKHNCNVMDVNTSGSKVSIHSVCKMEGSTATTDGVFEGAFDSRYKGTMKTQFSPPMHGMSESSMALDARWLGPCKPGQKPGDVIMPNMGGVDINEMMKQHQQQQKQR